MVTLPSVANAALPSPAAIDSRILAVMNATGSKGLSVAVIDNGEVVHVHAYGIRNAKGDPLTSETVMYGASLTKTVVAFVTMQLVDRGRIALDTPIADDLDKPLPTYGPDPVYPHKYGPYGDLGSVFKLD
jgi:CubicO group peptidase (beta-lactamase class C family)